MPFRFERLEIPDLVLIEPRLVSDNRGFFMETYKHSEYAAQGVKDVFVQENHSRSSRRTLRGLHYQKDPRAQGKLVRVIIGEIFRRSGGHPQRIADLRQMGGSYAF